MYLNPEICNASNIHTVESAVSYWNSHASSNIWTNLSVIPKGFDTAGFIGDSKSVIDISTLNSNIAHDMIMTSNVSNVDNIGTFAVPTMYYTVYNRASNVFYMNPPLDSTVKLNACNLIVGDKVRIIKNTLPVHFTVTSVDYTSNCFTVTGSNGYDPNSDYILSGIK
jgi:hypothetical protein